MKTTHIPLIEITGAICVLIICFAVALIIWPNLDNTSSTDWLQAIGTIGAFIGTIWIATSDAREKTEQSIFRGWVSLIDLDNLLIDIGANYAAANALLRYMNKNPTLYNPAEWNQACQDAADRLINCTVISPSVLHDLYSISKETAYEIADMQGQARTNGLYIKALSTSEKEVYEKHSALAIDRMTNLINRHKKAFSSVKSATKKSPLN